MKMNIKPSLRFQLTDLLKSSLTFFVTIVVITIFIPLIQLAVGDAGEVSFGGYAVIAGIYFFVVGIVAPISYVRIDIQMGVSRGTSFTVQLMAVVIAAAVLSVAGELMGVIVHLFNADGDSFFMGIYQLMYSDGEALSFGGHLVSICLNMCIGIFSYVSGMFYTLLFWRLNKAWSIVAALALVVVINLVINVGAFTPIMPFVSRLAIAFFDAVSKSPVPLIIFFLVFSLVLSGIEWLLLRRAYIRTSAA